MDPNKWVIFAYDRVPAHRFSAIRAPYVPSVCFLTLPPLDNVEQVCKSRLKATIRADTSRPESYKRNEAKGLGIPLEEFEHNNCGA